MLFPRKLFKPLKEQINKPEIVVLTGMKSIRSPQSWVFQDLPYTHTSRFYRVLISFI